MDELSNSFIVGQNLAYDAPAGVSTLTFNKYTQTEYAKRWLMGDEFVSPGAAQVTMPYAQLVWVYRSIKILSDSAAMLPLKVSKNNDRKNVVESGPVVDYWVEPGITQIELVEQTVGHKNLTGEAHWILAGMGRNTKIIKVVGKHQIKPITSQDKTELLGWEYQEGRQKIRVSLTDIISDINWSPYEQFRGQSPCQAAALTFSQEYQANKHNEQRLANNAEPGGALVTDEFLTDNQLENMDQAWNAKHRNTGRTAILHGGLKWQQVALSYKDMLFADLKKMTREEIISGAFGVHLVMAGIVDDANYGFADAVQEMHWTTTMPPVIRKLNGMMSTLTKRVYGETFDAWLDIKAAAIFAKLLKDKIEQGKNLIDMGFTANDVNTKLDLGMETMAWNDESYIAASNTTRTRILEDETPEFGDLPDEQEEEDQEETDGKAQSKGWASKATKKRIWQAWIRSWAGLEKRTNAHMIKYFIDWQNAVLSRARKSLSINKGTEKIPATIVDFNFLFGDRSRQDKKLRKLMEGEFETGLQFGVEQAAAELSLQSSVIFGGPDPILAAIRAAKVVKVVSLNETVRKQVERKVKKAFDNLDGGTIGDLAKELNQTLRESIHESFKMTSTRARTIARTEMSQTVSAGRHRTFQKAGVETKRWLTAGDENVRGSHAQAGATYGSEGIPFNSKFIVGGSPLDHPSDPNGPAKEVINCRCMELKGEFKGQAAPTLEEIETKGFLQWKP